ncbi:hypothetical protein PILCRDRAFT_16906 [Piloderma croceum F 1598]|uniref:Uncharacterized protein n=1 Tax=Piloderma croceum (strain F 1598) TaxID=765440 RepID=A0A0C3EUY3_PILCF|nr:hypothetical protein PILCRDRAFT_16906 [Piloderma croceum F 1598]
MLSHNSAVSECSGSPISLSREKHAVSTMWKKIVHSNSQSPRPSYDKHHDPLAGSLDNPLVSTNLAFAL